MAKKKTGTLLVGCAAVVVLGIAYAGVVKYNSYVEEKEAEESEAARIYMTSLSDVTSVQYGEGTDALLFEKNDEDTWQYAGDEDFPVKQTKLETIELYLTELEATRKFSDPDELDGYGLSEPSEVISFKDSDGGEYTLSIGNETDTSEYYAMISGDDSVYTISTTVPNAISHELYDFLEMDELPSLTSSTIETISITVDAQERSWNKQVVEVPETEEETTEASAEDETDTSDETDSALEEPEIATASGETEEETTEEPETTEVWFADEEQLDEDVSGQVDEVAEAIAALDFADCANYKGAENLEEYGLDEPQAVISWTGDGESATLYIGDKVEDGDSTYYYAQVDGSDMVNRITASLVEAVLQAEVGE